MDDFVKIKQSLVGIAGNAWGAIHYVGAVVSWLANNSPEWQRHLGKDHIFWQTQVLPSTPCMDM
jgi:hypothetical protein